MTARAWSLLLTVTGALALGLVCACVGDPEPPVRIATQVRQSTTYVWTRRAAPELMVLVVDDAPTADGRDLRELVAGYMDRWADKRRADHCVQADDPADYFPVDLHVLLIPTSDPTKAIHNRALPALRLKTDNATSSDSGDWEASVAGALLSLESSELSANRVFDAISHWSAIVDGTASPARGVDREFVESLPPNVAISVFVFTTRDDESSDILGAANFGTSFIEPHVLYRNLEHCPTSSVDEYVPRLVSAFHGALACDDNVLVDRVVCDSLTRCASSPPVLDSAGSAACRVLSYLNDDADCPESAGWFDPETASGSAGPVHARSPLDPSGKRRRVCEVRQLEGAALESCRSDPECSDCEPGWCWAEPYSDGFTFGQCVQGAVNWDHIRLTHGAGSAAPALLEVTCTLDP